jgi:hypothetical protein
MDYLKESYVSKFNKIYKDTKELEDTNKNLVDLNKRIHYLKHGSISPMLRTLIPFLLINSMGLPFLFNHDSFIEKDYKKTIEEYDSTSDTTTVIENYEDNEEGITAKVYTPWDYNEKKHQYERECREYSINDENVELEDIIYAINNDEAISKDVNKTKEVAEIKTKDMIYEGNQYVITKVTVSDTDYIVTEEAKKEADAASGVLFGLFVVLGGCVGVIRSLNYIDSISEIINEKKHLKELKKKIKALKVSSDDYQIDINNLIMQHDYLPFKLTEKDQNEEAFEYLYSNTVKEENFEDIYKKISNKNR